MSIIFNFISHITSVICCMAQQKKNRTKASETSHFDNKQTNEKKMNQIQKNASADLSGAL